LGAAAAANTNFNSLRRYELILLTVRIGFLKEKIVEVEPVRGGIRDGYLKLKFRDVGKWSGRGGGQGGDDVAFTGSEGWRNGAVFGASNNLGMTESGGGVDAKRFARLTREFEKLKKDKLGDPRHSYAGEGLRVRNKVGSRGGLTMSGGGRAAKGGRAAGGRGGLLNPEGHSKALGVSLGGGGRGMFSKSQDMGTGMLDSFGDRGAFF
jgi:hypothetical protein